MPAPTTPPDTTFDRINSLDYDPALSSALGNMIVAWSDAERSLQMTLRLATGMNWMMLIGGYYRIPTFESRVKFIIAILQEWDDPRKDMLIKVVEKLRNLSKARNDWVHGSYARGKSKKDVTIIFDYREPVATRLRPVKVNDIKVHSEAVKKRTNDIYGLTGWPPTPESA